MKFELGAKVKDTQSAFKGTVIGRHEYLGSETRYTVKSPVLAPSTGRIIEEFLNESNVEADTAPAAE